MTNLRLLVSLLYFVLGAVIVVRLCAWGLRAQTLSGMVLGAALVGLGAYRLLWFYRRPGGG